MLRSRKKKNKKRTLFLLFLISVTLGLAVCETPLENLEGFLFDLRTRLKPTSPVSTNIQTIAITKKTLKQLSSFPNASQYNKVVKTLIKHQPQSIILLKHPEKTEGSNSEKEQYAETLVNTSNVYIKGTASQFRNRSLTDELFLPPPFEKTRISMGSVMKDVTLGTKDKVARRVTISFDQQASLQAQIARSFSPNIQSFQGEFQIVDFVHAYIDYKPKGTYKPIDFLDILSQKFSPKDVQGKVILIGSDAESDADNYVFTPFSRDFTAMSRLEAEANAIDTLILNRSIIRPPKWVNQTLTVLAAFFTLYVVMSFNPAMGILSLILSLLVFSIMTYITLWTSQIWITMIHPILSVFVCYYFVIPYRLIVENRRSWEYFQKHKLLKQVEELKTNFLSMMSHDIKTPIARIQGMSEVILKEKELLSFNQKDSLKTIQESAEELSGFINTVLDLGRIENQKVQLKLTSKDINSLLKEVIQKHDFLARKKEIQIITEFEPLFSSQIDTELMRQVFANLIENAIKYSPPASKVLISTEEIDGKISIQVADQGKGIPPDEIENVFMKFYRSKNAKASSIKGSGLGLYLANYFVELHGGSISVESSVDQGSTFFVELPS